MFDLLLWIIAIFALGWGVMLLVLPKDKLMPALRGQLQKKGNSNPTEEDLEKKFKSFKLMGFVCIGAGIVLVIIMLTGGI